MDTQLFRQHLLAAGYRHTQGPGEQHRVTSGVEDLESWEPPPDPCCDHPSATAPPRRDLVWRQGQWIHRCQQCRHMWDPDSQIWRRAKPGQNKAFVRK